MKIVFGSFHKLNGNFAAITGTVIERMLKVLCMKNEIEFVNLEVGQQIIYSVLFLYRPLCQAVDRDIQLHRKLGTLVNGRNLILLNDFNNI